MKSKNEDLCGMTVNERLFHCGRMNDWDGALKIKDRESLIKILMSLQLTKEEAEGTVDGELDKTRRLENNDLRGLTIMGRLCLRHKLREWDVAARNNDRQAMTQILLLLQVSEHEAKSTVDNILAGQERTGFWGSSLLEKIPD